MHSDHSQVCPDPSYTHVVYCGHSVECVVDQWSTGVAGRRGISTLR